MEVLHIVSFEGNENKGTVIRNFPQNFTYIAGISSDTDGNMSILKSLKQRMVLEVGHTEGDYYYFFFITESRSKPPEPQQPESLVDFQILVFSFQKQKEKEKRTQS